MQNISISLAEGCGHVIKSIDKIKNNIIDINFVMIVGNITMDG